MNNNSNNKKKNVNFHMHVWTNGEEGAGAVWVLDNWPIK